MIDLQRHTDYGDKGKLFRGFKNTLEPSHGGIEQRPLMKQIIARIGRKPQFGKKREHGPLTLGSFHKLYGTCRVKGGICDTNFRYSHCNANKAVTIKVKELPVVFHLSPVSVL